MANCKLLKFYRPVMNAKTSFKLCPPGTRFLSGGTFENSNEIVNDVNVTPENQKDRDQNVIEAENSRQIIEGWIKQKSIDDARAKEKCKSGVFYFCRCIHVEDNKTKEMMPLTCLLAMQILEDKKNGRGDSRFLVLDGKTNRFY